MLTNKVNLTIQVTPDEVKALDEKWRGNLAYKNRADYIRVKLGLERVSKGEK